MIRNVVLVELKPEADRAVVASIQEGLRLRGLLPAQAERVARVQFEMPAADAAGPD